MSGLGLDGSLDPSDPATRRPQSRLGIGAGGGRAIAIAATSTIVVLVGLAAIIVNAPGWPAFQDKFLNGRVFIESLPLIAAAFLVNVRLFLIAEILILGLALVIAVLRGLPGPVFFPVRLLSTIYVDLFRALPGVLVIFILGLGIPSLRIERTPERPILLGRGRADAALLGLRFGGVPGRDRIRASVPERGGAITGPVALADAAPRSHPAGDPARDPAAPQ